MYLPTIKQKLRVILERGDHQIAFSSYVEDIADQTLVIVLPGENGIPGIPLRQGDRLRMEYVLPQAGRVSFRSRILGFDVRRLPVAILSLPSPDEIKTVQQREFMRLDISLDLTYCPLHYHHGTTVRGEKVESRTRDISGSGAQILCKKALRPGTLLELEINVGGQPVQAVAEVVRPVEPGRRRGEFWMGIRFREMSSRGREEIIRYVLNEQRERLRRGLL